ncbi:unnamed protein product, partial [Musa hybrid cultivar]
GNHPFRSHSIFPKSLAAAPLLRCISAFPFLFQEPQLQEPLPPTLPQLPRSPQPRHWEPLLPRELAEPDPRTRCRSFVGGRSLVPMGLPATARTMAFSQTLDVSSLMNVFADWMTSQRWSDLKQLFEL